VSICLNSPAPTAIWWGKAHPTIFSNDAYQAICGRTDRHGWLGCSGHDLPSDISAIVRPMIERVFATGEAACSEDQLVAVERNLLREDAYFTSAYSPIYNEAGEVGGVFCFCVETTGRVVAERRLRALRDLRASLAEVKTAGEACATAARVLAANARDVLFCLLYHLDEVGQRASLAGASGVEPGTEPAPLLIDFAIPDPPWPVGEVCRSGRARLVHKEAELASGAWRGLADSALVMPIAAAGKGPPAGVMIAGLSPRRILDDDYRDFFELAAAQIALAIARMPNAGAVDRAGAAEPNKSRSVAMLFAGNDSREPLARSLSPSDEPFDQAAGLDRRDRWEFLRREAELALLESEHRFARFMRHLPGLAWIKDLEGRYVYANDSALKAFRTQRPDLYGKTDDEVFPPEVAAQFRENDRRALANETGIQTIETLEHEDGLVHHSIVSKFPIPGWDDQAALVGGMAVDITDLIRAEEAIRESEQRFRGLAEAMPQMVYVSTPDGEVEYLNQRWRDFTGMSGTDHASIKEVVHPDDYAFMIERWLGAAARGSPYEAEIRIRRASDGAFRWFLTRALPIAGAQGIVTKWFGTSTDIDDQKRSEQGQHLLAEAGRLLNSSLDYQSTLTNVCKLAVPTLADWCSLDLLLDDGQVQHLEVAHTDPAKLELAREYRRLLPARPDDWVALMRVLRTGQPEIIAELSDHDLAMRARDEEELRRLRELGAQSVMIVPITARGRALGALTLVMAESLRRYGEDDLRLAIELGYRAALAVDNARLLEEARQAGRRREEALKLHCEIEQQLTLLVEASASLCTSLDLPSVLSAIMVLSRRLVAADAYAVWHYVSTTGCWEIALAAGLSDHFQQAKIQVLAHTPPMPDVPIVAENIAEFPVLDERKNAYEREGIHSLLVVPLTVRGDRYGTIAFYYRAPHRFTEVEVRVATALSNLAGAAVGSAQLYEEQRANDRRKDEFLAMLAHELRNPLAAIDSAVSLIGASVPGHDPFDWSVDVIGRHVRHLTRLIDDLLDVSRITRGKIELRKKKIDARPVLNSAIESVRMLLEERQHRLTTSYGQDLFVEADPTRLEQIAVNLLSNAAKYTESGGQIWFTARHEENEFVIRVRDTGVGIPPEQLASIFDLFVQGDRSLERSAGGLGIGLTLVQKLTELHGGTVVARSEGAGTGSEFIVRLPAGEESNRERSRPRPQSEPRSKRAARVLVVDDNVDLARGLARLLEMRGHNVSIAFDGPSAVDKARELHPEFVLLDIGLPGMDGYQVAALLRQEPDTKDAVIVAVSGYGQDEDRKRSQQAGFDLHLVKPVSCDELIKVFERPRKAR